MATSPGLLTYLIVPKVPKLDHRELSHAVPCTSGQVLSSQSVHNRRSDTETESLMSDRQPNIPPGLVRFNSFLARDMRYGNARLTLFTSRLLTLLSTLKMAKFLRSCPCLREPVLPGGPAHRTHGSIRIRLVHILRASVDAKAQTHKRNADATLSRRCARCGGEASLARSSSPAEHM